MDRDKLREIGGTVGLTDRDISDIRKRHHRIRILSPIIGGITAVLASVIGYVVGSSMGSNAGGEHEKLVNSDTGEVYPYAIPALFVFTTAISHDKVRSRTRMIVIITALATIILGILGFLYFQKVGYDSAYEAARPIRYYTGSILYGVYSRDR